MRVLFLLAQRDDLKGTMQTMTTAGITGIQAIGRSTPLIRFAGRDRFSEEQAARMAKTLLAESRRLEITPEQGFGLTESEITPLLLQGKRIPLKGTHFLGILYPDGSVVSTDSDTRWEKFIQRVSTGTKLTTFRKIMGYLHPRMPKGVIPSTGLPIVVRERDPASVAQVKAFVKEDLIPHFQVKEEVPLKNGKSQTVMETVTWPFLSHMITNHPIPESACPLAKKLKALPVFQVNSPDADSGVEQTLRHQYGDLHKMLAAVETARAHYSEGLEWEEALVTFVMAGGFGLAGELAIEHYLPEENMLVGAARSGVLLSMDVVENTLNSVGMLRSSLGANGLLPPEEEHPSVLRDMWRVLRHPVQSFRSPKSWWGEILCNPIQSLRSPKGLFIKRAAASAAKGTALGSGFSMLAGFGLSDPNLSISARAGASAAGALGTATTIPFNTRSTLPQVYLATLELMKSGKIRMPDSIQSPEQVKDYALEVARQELSSRLACAASIKGFTMLPLVSIGIIGSEALGMPRQWVQWAFMFTAPAMESILRLVLTAEKQLISVPGRMARAEKLVLSSPELPFPEKERRAMAHLFADRWSRFSLACMTPLLTMPEPAVFPSVQDGLKESESPCED